MNKHAAKVEALREQLAAKRAEQDQRAARREAAEDREDEIDKLNVAVDLGEMEAEEAAARKAEIAGEIDDAREAERIGAAAVEELERRVDEAGDAWAESVTLEPQRTAYAAQQERKRIEALLAEARRVEEARLAALAEARERAQAIVDETRETSWARNRVMERKHAEHSRATAAIREAVKWSNASERDRLLAGDYGDEARQRYLDQLAEHERVRAYWDERARKHEPPPQAPVPKPVATEGS